MIVTAVEAIIWIVCKEWRKPEEFSARYAEQDRFWLDPFRPRGSDIVSRAASALYDFNLHKKRQRLDWVNELLSLPDGLPDKSYHGDGKERTENLNAWARQAGLDLAEYAEALGKSILLEQETTEILRQAREKLLETLQAAKIKMYGRQQAVNGDKSAPQEIPHEQFMTQGMWIDIRDNALRLAPEHDSIGWLDLTLGKADIERLWTNNITGKNDEQAADGVAQAEPYNEDNALTFCKAWIDAGNIGRENYRPAHKKQFPSTGNKEADHIIKIANQQLGRGRSQGRPRKVAKKISR